MMGERVAVIVGAGSGMGEASARRLAKDGFNIATLSFSGKGSALAEELNGIGQTGSNRDSDDLQHLVDAVLARWGRLDVLVNSAGHGPRGPILELSDDEWREGFETYFLNVVRAVRVVAPVMADQNAGSIINISTAWALEPSPMFPTSAVARAALAAYTKLFADEYASGNIRINNILPGWIDSLPGTEERRASVPMKRYGRVDEIAATVSFLASEDSSYITGQNIRVDGGLIRSL